VRPGSFVRCAVLALAVLLTIDASWCCDDMIIPQTSTMTVVASSDVCGDDGGQLDCRACICSGLALVETAPVHIPHSVNYALAESSPGKPASETASIDVPPNKHA
jgi:hypothetical protein